MIRGQKAAFHHQIIRKFELYSDLKKQNIHHTFAYLDISASLAEVRICAVCNGILPTRELSSEYARMIEVEFKAMRIN